MFRALILCVMALATVLPVFASLSAQPTESGRPLVLVVHGRGVQGQDTTFLRDRWWRSLDRGLTEVAQSAFLRREDLRVVWYSEALRPERPAACERPPEGTTGTRGSLGDVMAAAGNLIAMAAELVAGPEAVELRSVAGDLLYLGDDTRRCAAEERLAAALLRAESEDRPVILVSHSFGSLVSYRHLRTSSAAPGPGIERYVTVGSLIGQPELRGLLMGRPLGSQAGWSTPEDEVPASVHSWVNVRDPADPFAAPLIALGNERAREVRDLRTERPTTGDPHDLGRYLADPATARSVLEAWCATRSDLVPAAGCASP